MLHKSNRIRTIHRAQPGVDLIAQALLDIVVTAATSNSDSADAGDAATTIT